MRKIAKIGPAMLRKIAKKAERSRKSADFCIVVSPRGSVFGGETGGRGSILLAPEKGESRAILTAVFHKLRFENSRGGMTNIDIPLLKFDYAGVRKLVGIMLIINNL